METMRIFESVNIIKSVLASFVRKMQSKSPIQTNHKHSHVISDTNTRTHSHLFKKVSGIKFSIFTILLFMDIPDITHIQKYCTIQITPNSWSIFQIGNKLNVTRLVYIRELTISRRKFARSDTSYIESSDAIGSSYIELLIIRSFFRISITPDYTCIQMPNKRGFFRQLPIFYEISL